MCLLVPAHVFYCGYAYNEVILQRYPIVGDIYIGDTRPLLILVYYIVIPQEIVREHVPYFKNLPARVLSQYRDNSRYLDGSLVALCLIVWVAEIVISLPSERECHRTSLETRQGTLPKSRLTVHGARTWRTSATIPFGSETSLFGFEQVSARSPLLLWPRGKGLRSSVVTN